MIFRILLSDKKGLTITRMVKRVMKIIPLDIYSSVSEGDNLGQFHSMDPVLFCAHAYYDRRKLPIPVEKLPKNAKKN